MERGRIGEAWVREYLEASAMHVYAPGAVGRHPIDFFVVGADCVPWACDVKTYPRRAFFQDTGIDAADWKKYADIALNVPVRVFFADAFERCVYSVEVPGTGPNVKESGGKVYVPLSSARFEFCLTEERVRVISSLDTGVSYRHTRLFFKR